MVWALYLTGCAGGLPSGPELQRQGLLSTLAKTNSQKQQELVPNPQKLQARRPEKDLLQQGSGESCFRNCKDFAPGSGIQDLFCLVS